MALSRVPKIVKYFWMTRYFSIASGHSRRIRFTAINVSRRVRIKIISQHLAKPPELGATACQSWRCFMKILCFLSIFHRFWAGKCLQNNEKSCKIRRTTRYCVLALKAAPETLGACHDIVLYVAGVPVERFPGRIAGHYQVLRQVRYTQDWPTTEVCLVTNENQ